MTKAWGLISVLFATAFATASQAQLYTISTAADTFTPSFRGEDNATYFGWASGTFDGGLDDELMDNPLPSLSDALCLAGTLDQVGTTDILAGSNNIYIGTNGRNEALSLSVPTRGLPGPDGFTTVIIQGLTLTGGPAANTIVNYPTFGAIDGVLPTFVIGLNANSPSPGQGQGQWLVKYELPGNRDVYSLSISLVNAGGPQAPLTISKFEVDTFYSATVFAMDDAQAVPEPTTVRLTIVAVTLIAWFKRKDVFKTFLHWRQALMGTVQTAVR